MSEYCVEIPYWS